MEQTGVKAFLKRKNVNITVKTYLIDAMGAMAFGLFASSEPFSEPLGIKPRWLCSRPLQNTAKVQPALL